RDTGPSVEKVVRLVLSLQSQRILIAIAAIGTTRMASSASEARPRASALDSCTSGDGDGEEEDTDAMAAHSPDCARGRLARQWSPRSRALARGIHYLMRMMA